MKAVTWASMIVAMVAAVLALAILVFYVFNLIPSVSKGIDNAFLGFKRPICCNLIGCKPAIEQITQNPLAGPICSVFCLNVCT